MITLPTVLVLGAGASAHLDFPLGEELYKRVCAALDKDQGASRAGDHTPEYAKCAND